VLERSYNKYRTGADTAETVLTPANVKSTANLFHKQFVMKVDGKIEGSPLMPPRSPSPAASTTSFMPRPCRLAFDADTGAQLSVRWLGTPITGFDLGVLKPVTIHSKFGVVSTPVIDP
jgi:hypothetical protein